MKSCSLLGILIIHYGNRYQYKGIVSRLLSVFIIYATIQIPSANDKSWIKVYRGGHQQWPGKNEKISCNSETIMVIYMCRSI